MAYVLGPIDAEERGEQRREMLQDGGQQLGLYRPMLGVDVRQPARDPIRLYDLI